MLVTCCRAPRRSLLRVLRTCAFAALSIAPLLSVPAQAQNGPAQESSALRFDIAGGALDGVLNRFAIAAGLVLSADAGLTAGKTSAGLRGVYTPREGLRRLLSGTGLSADFDGERNVTIVTEPQARRLAPVSVRGGVAAVDAGRSEGTGAYTTEAITIGRTAQSLRETPQSVSVVTRQQLDEQNAHTVSEAMRYATGVTVRHYGTGTDNISARGYDFSNYQVDGMPVSAGKGSWSSSFFDLALYDRVEIWRGPSGLLDGAGDPGGTVNFVRKRAQRQFQAKGSLSAGSWDAYRGELDVTGPLNADGSLRGRAVAVHDDRQSFTDYVSSRKKVVFGTVSQDLGDATTLTLGGAHQSGDHRPFYGVSVYPDGTLAHLPRSTFVGADWNQKDEGMTSYFAELAHTLKGGGQATVSARRSHRRSDSKHLGWGATPIDPDTGEVLMLPIAIETEEVDTGLDARLNLPFSAFGGQHEALLGVSWQRNRTDNGYSSDSYGQGGVNQDIFDPDVHVPEPDLVVRNNRETKTDQSAFYGQVRLRPWQRTTVLLGGRLAWWKTSDRVRPGAAQSLPREFVPYAGVLYDLIPRVSVYGSYSTIFAPQTSQGRDGDLLEPREGRQYEIGLKGESFERRLNAHVALFRIEDRNRSMTDPAAPPGAGFAIASGEVVSQGGEIEISGEILPRWNLKAGYTYTETEFKEGGEGVFSSQTPRHAFTLWTRYRFAPGALNSLSVGGGVRAQSKIWYETSGIRSTQEHYTVATLQAGYEYAPGSEVTLTIDNLFDEYYYASLGGTRQTYFGEPRSVTLTVRHAF
ncbi:MULTISPECIES: TonB-dependent siderophore receptor [Alcanivorax]|uniref:TonB-dependent siderophore receptor n=1 Tax=Alcanivorax TaxID=59753 RepID=UPI00105F0113|nr:MULTISPECIES: TonB-dependent siderophore receptor [Alcanivorax]